MLLAKVKEYVNKLGHQLLARDELVIIAIEKEFQEAYSVIANLAQRVSNLEDINKLALPKAKFIQQKLQGNRINKDSTESELEIEESKV